LPTEWDATGTARNVVAIVQARMGSTRLPGKVLADLAGEPLLARVMNRLCRARRLNAIGVATTVAAADDAIASLCAERGWTCFRGSEHDVLDRYHRAAATWQADVIVRITADCPLIDPDIVDDVVGGLMGPPASDYAVTVGFPRGLDTEAVSRDALARTWRETTREDWREHVTPYIYLTPGAFRVREIRSAVDRSHLRWTVDTPEDLALIRLIIGHFGHDRFATADVLEVLESHPNWLALNCQVVQWPVPGAEATPR